jgi:lipoate-protein ligase A
MRRAIEKRVAGSIDIVDRDSGGGAVLTGPWLVSVSVVIPHRHPMLGQNIGDSYRGLAQLHVSALENFGVTSRVWFPSDLIKLPALDDLVLDWACFGGLSQGEVINGDGRKLVGLSQKRNINGVLLVVGTLVGCVEWKLLCDAMDHDDQLHTLSDRTISMQEIRGEEIDVKEFSNELTQRLSRWMGLDEKILRS